MTLVCGGLLLLAITSFAAGEYQQTKDGKTFIWNGTPKPGESATWSGDRDKENYATGIGALTWYTATGKVYGLYYGNMVHGKLDGPVNVHTNGRTAHAYFVDGGRVTGWARGPAPSKMVIPEEAVVEKRKVQAERAEAAAKAEARAAAAEEAEKKAKIEREAKAEERARERVAKSEATPEEKVAPPKPESTASPRKPEVSSAETPAPEVKRKESPPIIAEKKIEPPATASPARAFDEPTAIPARSEIVKQPPSSDYREPRKSESIPLPTIEPTASASVVNEPPREVAPEPKSEIADRTSAITRGSPTPASAKKESSGDVSLKALVGPPSSLRATTETSTPKTETATSTSTPRDNAPLTEAEAINLADTEARVQGFYLDDYQRPKVDHSAVKGRWSLFYGPKNTGQSGTAFTITVEDKTRKVEIKR